LKNPGALITFGCQFALAFNFIYPLRKVFGRACMRYFFVLASILWFFLIGCEPAEKKQESLALQSDLNLAAGKAFLKENKNRPDIISTDSGLQYRIIRIGNGPVPSDDSAVEVHYVGRFIDGREFDSSIKRGMPAKFGVKQVILGWTEALEMMPEGSIWELFIPPNLAYGSAGQGPIGPSETLVFEVELLKASVQ
jgi:FKBP-type peptidyl-prolyl cis-trans isomerase